MKEKLRAGFSLELRVEDATPGAEDPADRADSWVARSWPCAQLVERFEGRLLYRIPQGDVPSIARAFEILQSGQILSNEI